MPDADMQNKVPEIAIIGGGFCGMMTTVHLMQHCRTPLIIHLINKGYPLARGVAYAPHSDTLLLNIPNGNMSAFPDQPDHFVNWLRSNGGQHESSTEDLTLGFSYRAEYGNYLCDIWLQALQQKPVEITVNLIDDLATDIIHSNDQLSIKLQHRDCLNADLAVLATGNSRPADPYLEDASFYSSSNYFSNPWKRESICNLRSEKDILILGNGLTMMDTVYALVMARFSQTIHTVSPGGYNIEAHQSAGTLSATFDIDPIINEDQSLLQMLRFVNKYRKMAKRNNLSYYPAIDALRPYTQQIWQSWSSQEKQRFYNRLRRFWDKARHRSPIDLHGMIKNLCIQNNLVTHKGYVSSIQETVNGIEALICSGGKNRKISIERVINCTGIAHDPRLSDNELLRNMELKGMLAMDSIGIGLRANPRDGAVIDAKGKISDRLFMIGANLKGVLWESTAIPELRLQASELAKTLLLKLKL